MKLEVMNAAEARNLVDNHRSAVTDWHIKKVMANINDEIIRRASLGETSFIAYASLELSKIGFRDFGRDNREDVFRPIIDTLRESGYEVEVGPAYFSGGVAEITIHW